MSRALFNAWGCLERNHLKRVIVRTEPREHSDGVEHFPVVVCAWNDQGEQRFGTFGNLADWVDALSGEAPAVFLTLGKQPRLGSVAECGCDPWEESVCTSCGGSGWVWTDLAVAS